MIIAVSVPLAERSEAAIGRAIEWALESAVRDAMTRGLDSVELVSARLVDDRVDVRVQAPSVEENEALRPGGPHGAPPHSPRITIPHTREISAGGRRNRCP